MDWQFTPFSLPLIVAAAVSAALAFIAWRRRAAPGVLAFVVLMLGVAVWTLAYALEMASAGLAHKLFWAKAEYLGIAAVPAAWLASTLQYTGRARWLTRRNLGVLALPGVLMLLLALTNELHHLVWTSMYLDGRGAYSVLVLTHGPAFGVFIAYTYFCLVLGSIVLFRTLLKRPYPYRGQLAVVLVAMLAPWAANILYIAGLSPIAAVDVTPLAFTLTCLAVGLGVFRFRLLDIVPVARDTVVDSMSDAVIVLDLQDRVVDINQAAARLAGCRAAEAIGQPAAAVFRSLPALADWCATAGESRREIGAGEGESRRILDAGSTHLHGRQRHAERVGRLLILRDITERRRAEQSIRDNELKYHTLFETSIDAIFLETLEGRVLDCNAAACSMLGYAKEELLALSVADLVPDDVARTLPDVITEELAAGGVFAEAFNKAKDGRVFPVEVSTRLVTIGDEQRVLVCVRDISRRKRLEQQSRERRLYLESVLACAPDAIVTLDAEHRILDWNPGAEALFSYRQEEVMGRHLDPLVSGSDGKTLDETTRLTRQVIAGMPVLPTETVRYCADGSPVDVIVAGAPILVRGEVTGVVAIYTDIRERKRAEKVLRESEDKYRTLVEQSLQGVVIAQGSAPRLIFANAAMAEIAGYSIDELLAMSPAELRTRIYAADQATFFRRYQERLSGSPAPARYEVRLVRRDGTLRWVEMFANHIDVATGSAVQATFVDITERKRAEEELRAGEERYRSLYSMVRLMCDNVPDLIWAKDMDRRFIFANKAISDKLLHARDADEPIGKTDLFFANREREAHPDDRQWHTFGEICRDSDAVVMIGRQPERFDEFGNVRGEFLYLDVYKAPFWNEKGEMIGTVGSARIVTREKEMEKQREQAREALRRRSEQLEALRQVGLEIGAQLDLDTLLHSIVSRAVDLLGGAIGAFYLYRAERDVLQIVVAVGGDSDIVGRTLGSGEGLAGRVWSSGGPLVVDDYQQWDGRAPIFDGQGFRATVGVPVRCGAEFVGVLDVVGDAPGLYSTSDAELLNLFATQAAIGIQNARLYDEARRRNRDLVLLNRVIAASAASRGIKSILQVVCREMAAAFDSPHSAAALLNARGTEVEVIAEHHAEGRASVLGEKVSVADIAVVRDLCESKEPQIVDDARTDPRLGRIARLIPAGEPLSLLMVPILIEGEVVAGLGLAAVGPRSFAPGDVGLASRVAEQVSGALARARLAEAERRLGAAVDQAAEAVIVTDAEGVITYINPAFEQMVGITRAEAIGRHPRSLLGSNTDVLTRGEQWRAAGTGRSWQQRLEYTRPDGRVCHLDLTAAPVYDESGQTVSFVATTRDVTRETQLEAESQQAQKMEALGRMAGGVAHDFNNLLAAIQLSGQLLMRMMSPDEPLREHVRPILDTVERATRLTGQLLRFSRREVIQPRALELNRVIGDLGRMLGQLMGEDIHLVTALSDGLWPVQADPAQIDQVIVNLAVNARDAMRGGGTLTLETANVVIDEAYASLHLDARPGEYVLLAVSDTGAGMDEGVKARAFEPFFTTKARGEGTGLGLATVFGIVKQGGGWLEVYSEVGHGTTFKVYLPRLHEVEAPAEAMSPVRGPAAIYAPRATETVLLVEDDAPVRELAARVLESSGYRVLAAADGLEALHIGERHAGPIHLLLTDVVLPHMSGSELARRLLKKRPETRAVYMSGYTDGAIAQHGVLPPGVFFLAKPFTIDDLTRTVRQALGGNSPGMV